MSAIVVGSEIGCHPRTGAELVFHFSSSAHSPLGARAIRTPLAQLFANAKRLASCHTWSFQRCRQRLDVAIYLCKKLRILVSGTLFHCHCHDGVHTARLCAKRRSPFRLVLEFVTGSAVTNCSESVSSSCRFCFSVFLYSWLGIDSPRLGVGLLARDCRRRSPIPCGLGHGLLIAKSPALRILSGTLRRTAVLCCAPG